VKGIAIHLVVHHVTFSQPVSSG